MMLFLPKKIKYNSKVVASFFVITRGYMGNFFIAVNDLDDKLNSS